MATQPPQTGTVKFVDAYAPILEAGEYLITVEQSISGKDSNGATIAENYVHARRLFVQGERFSLDPSEIAGVFPGNLNRGDHDNVLPQICFSRKTLPWERDPGISRMLKEPPTLRAPWLALLVFFEDDAPIVGQNVKLGELAHVPYKPDPNATTTVPSSLPAYTASYADGYAATFGKDKQWELEAGQHHWDICRVIDIPVELFSTIAPSCTDLGWLAHARTISDSRGVADAARSSSADEQNAGDAASDDFSLVFANRFPESNASTTVHLVSLEGMAAFLPTDDNGTPAHIQTIAKQDATFVRLVSLYSWSFTCEEPKESFSGYLKHVNVGPLQRADVPPDKATTEDQIVRQALAMGYTALDHDTRYGDRTVSWYHGPFVPSAAPIPDQEPSPPIGEDGAPTGIAPLATADEALRYDPTTGMFDVSYAASWQLGRLMALRDKSFSLALMTWKRMNTHKTFAAIHREAIDRQFGAALALVPLPPEPPRGPRSFLAPDKIAPTARGPVRETTARRAAFQLVGNLESLFDSLNADRDGESNGSSKEVK
jgi:hypothetical protein